MTIHGTNFIAPVTVTAGSGVSVSNVTVQSATQLRATFTITSGTATGTHDVRVTTLGGQTSAVNAGDRFTVN
jgi:hypothetical protein